MVPIRAAALCGTARTRHVCRVGRVVAAILPKIGKTSFLRGTWTILVRALDAAFAVGIDPCKATAATRKR